MKVELLPHAKQKGLYSIVLDDHILCYAHQAIFGSFVDLPKESPSKEEFLIFFRLLEVSQAKRYALKKLSMRGYHSSELTALLQEKSVSTPTINEVVFSLKQAGYLNDQEWIEGFIRYQKRKHFGPRMIALKLRAKGITLDSLEALNSHFGEQDQKKQIHELLRKKFSKFNLHDFKERNRIFNSLLRKGFSLDMIKEVLNEVVE